MGCRSTVAARDPATRSVAGARTLAGARADLLGLGSLVKVSHGLVVRQKAGDPSFPLDLSAWSSMGNISGSWGAGSQGPTDHIQVQSLDQDRVYVALLDTAGILAEPMVYAILSGADEPAVDIFNITGICLMSDGDTDPLTNHFLQCRYRLHEDITVDNDRLFMSEQSAGVSLTGNQRLLTPLKRDVNDWAWMVAHATQAGAYSMYDGFAAQQVDSIFTRTPPHGRTGGQVGVMVVGSSAAIPVPSVHINAVVVVAARYATILDAPAGAVARVLDAGGAELASGTEAGGELAVDMMVLGDQVVDPNPSTGLPDNPRPEEAVTLRLEDGAGEELAEITPTGATAGVWGGDVYSFAECS